MLVSTASARPRRKAPETDAPPPVVEEVEAPAVPTLERVFDRVLPIETGPVPTGLGSLSAQGCNGCHYDAHDGWARSAHATGFADPVFQHGVALAASPVCTECHLPLWSQHAERFTPIDGSPDRVATAPNDAFDATLAQEGVTCAACHVRDGQIVVAEPVANAPHPTVVSPQLRAPELCATCHSLTWPGADKPLYDTYGEWERSPYAAAGITCQACHLGRAADGGLVAHDVAQPAERAVTLLVDVDKVSLVRGGGPLAVALRVQNTGAGHAFPTGSPWRVVRVQAALVGPVGKKGEVLAHPKATWSAELKRTIEDAPPWRTLADTRVSPGEEASFATSLALPSDAQDGVWTLEVSLAFVRDGKAEAPFVVQRTPLRVD